MTAGLLWALMAGCLVGLQNIFNSKTNEHAGSWVTTVLVLGLGFAASFTIGLVLEGSRMFELQNMKLWYWFSGIIGVGVVFCITQGIRLLGPTYATSLALLSQLGFAMVWDTLGWLGLEKVPLSPKQFIGVLVIAGGILVFKSGDLIRKKESKAMQAARSTQA